MSPSSSLASSVATKRRRKNSVLPSKFAWEFKYYSLVKEEDDGSHWFQCNFCKDNPRYQGMETPPGVFRGTRIRLRSHLFSLGRHSVAGCKSITNDELHEVRKAAQHDCRLLGLKTDAELVSMQKTYQPADISSSLSSGSIPMATIQTSINFDQSGKETLDSAIGRFIFYGGLPLNVVRNPYFKQMLEAVRVVRGPICVPHIDHLRTTLLTNERAETEKKVNKMTKAAGATKLTIASDGWENVSKKPIINCMIVSPSGEYFYDSIHTGFETKTGEYIKNYIEKCILDIGVENVIQFITDRASNCKRAGHLIENEYKNIFYSVCSAHSVDLILKDMGKLLWIKETIEAAKEIVFFFRNHQKINALFSSLSKLQLIMPATTRFATNFLMMDRLCEVRRFMRQVVTTSEWGDFLNMSPLQIKLKGLAIESRVLQNSAFWATMVKANVVCSPIVSLLRLVDGPRPMIGKIYNRMETVGKVIDSLLVNDAEIQSQVKTIFSKRWAALHSPLHCTGLLLDP